MADIKMNWVERLHAPRYIWSQIAALNPRHGILCREEKGQQQLFSWDIYLGDETPLTPPVDYIINATLDVYGHFVTYLVPHPTHADVYQYVRVPFDGGEPQPIAPTALMNASPHIEEANGRIGFTAVTGNGYSVQIWTPEGKKPLFSYESEVLAYGPSLSFDGTIAVIATMHSAEFETTYLEAYTIDTGAKISQLSLPNTPFEAVKFAPVMGDSRLLVQAREGLLTRPLVWDVKTGVVDRLVGLDKESSYGVWDWMGNKQILVGDRGRLYLYDVAAKRFTWGEYENKPDRYTLAYTTDSSIVYHKDWYHAPFIVSSFNQDNTPFHLVLPVAELSQSRTSRWNNDACWTVTDKSPGVIRIFEDQSNPTLSPDTFVEAEAWLNQNYGWCGLDIWGSFKLSPGLSWRAIESYRKSEVLSNISPLLTAHNMGAALALLTLHQSDASVWAGGVVVRPILDWVHLYESVAPPEKAMMRLWFGGSPEEVPQMWRAASPLRQTTPLKVPVKILYHPYDSLVPIQHIQTYAANNPSVELIDISRDMVGPAHEQQERLITRMLQAGLPLLQKGTSQTDESS